MRPCAGEGGYTGPPSPLLQPQVLSTAYLLHKMERLNSRVR